MPLQHHLSASSVLAFKACPQRFRLAYREGIRPAEDTDAQRVGTNWHAMHELYNQQYRVESERRKDEVMDGNIVHEESHQAAFAAVIDHLNAFYATRPDTKTPEEWEGERQVLIYSFIGYLWYWGNDPVDMLGEEVPFDLPLHFPRTGMPLPTSEVIRRGKIDGLAVWQNKIVKVERKSTSRAIAADSDYWQKSRKDTQVSMYALAVDDLLAAGDLPQSLLALMGAGQQLGQTLYDVWHKPTIKPTTLSQKDSVEFLESGKYHGVDFKVEATEGVRTVTKELKSGPKVTEVTILTGLLIDGHPATFEVSESSHKPAIRETPEMFGARLLADIYERPEFYYARKEITRTDAEVRKFRAELFNIYQSQKLLEENNTWFENEQQCEATFRCQYMPICYGPGADAVCDGKTTPAGFKRIFDVTVEGKEIEE